MSTIIKLPEFLEELARPAVMNPPYSEEIIKNISRYFVELVRAKLLDPEKIDMRPRNTELIPIMNQAIYDYTGIDLLNPAPNTSYFDRESEWDLWAATWKKTAGMNHMRFFMQPYMVDQLKRKGWTIIRDKRLSEEFPETMLWSKKISSFNVVIHKPKSDVEMYYQPIIVQAYRGISSIVTECTTTMAFIIEKNEEQLIRLLLSSGKETASC